MSLGQVTTPLPSLVPPGRTVITLPSVTSLQPEVVVGPTKPQARTAEAAAVAEVTLAAPPPPVLALRAKARLAPAGLRLVEREEEAAQEPPLSALLPAALV